MKINALQLLFKLLSNKKSYPVKIVSIGNNSTELVILNKKIVIPKLLNHKKKYIAKIERGQVEIIEVKDKQNTNGLLQIKEKIKTFVDTKFIGNVGNQKEDVNLIFVFFNSFLEDKKNLIEKNKDKENNFYYSNEESYYFLFTLPFYMISSKIFIKIDKKKRQIVSMSILTDESLNTKKKEIQDKFLKKFNNITFFLNIMTNKDDFINMIFSLMNLDKIDVKI